MTSPRGVVIDTLRTMWTDFPLMRPALDDVETRRKLTEALLKLYRAPEHSIDQCLGAVTRAGYYVSEHRPVAPRPHEPAGKSTGEHLAAPEPVNIPSSLDTQRGRLLAAYAAAGSAGLTSEEAREEARLPTRSCFWKRVSELRQGGMLDYLLDANDEIVRRPGLTESLQSVFTITPYGQGIVATLEKV